MERMRILWIGVSVSIAKGRPAGNIYIVIMSSCTVSKAPISSFVGPAYIGKLDGRYLKSIWLENLLIRHLADRYRTVNLKATYRFRVNHNTPSSTFPRPSTVF